MEKSIERQKQDAIATAQDVYSDMMSWNNGIIKSLNAAIKAAVAEYPELMGESLPSVGPRGGYNAARIPGWSAPGITALSKAIRSSGVYTMKSWNACGKGNTPTVAIPTILVEVLREAIPSIFTK